MAVHHMMKKIIIIIIFFFSSSCLQLLITPALSLPLCTDSRTPLTPKTPLVFCAYNGTSCCDSTQDSNIQKQFEAMNVSQPHCASLLKSILCSRCDPFSAQLFTVETAPRQIPVLCNSSQTNQSKNNFCETVWDACENIPINNSPFSPSLQGQAPTPPNSSNTLSDIWQSQTDFCNIVGGPSLNGSVCFDGEKVSLNITTNSTKAPPTGMCLEKINNGSYLDMVAHTDGSNRAFFSNQKGQIWLATVPEVGSGRTLDLDESNPFLDLTDEVHFDTQFGLMSIALHPNFAHNGRFFASFNCDKSQMPSCAGRCACNSDVNCDPSKLPPDSAAQPCQYQSVVAEYTVNGAASSRASVIPNASPVEVRRIFTMGLPFTSHHAGQILFGPNDGYLYFMMGDGGAGDPYNFAQDKKSLLGKIMRFDVDNIPSEAEITRLGIWGNYSIPRDNPYVEDKDLHPEIWALGFSNPWRCSFDAERPAYFMCADVGQNEYEEVDVITKNGNYGWRVYEGPTLYTPEQTPGGNTSARSINPIFPVMGYKHSDINKNEGSASITGGFFYRSMTDPCLYGSYLYGDLYAGAMWAGVETPENSGNFTTSDISFACAKDSPIPCSLVPGSSLPALGYLFSYGQDNKKDMYLLSSSGVYRIVPPSRCGYTCAYENTTTSSSLGPASTPGSSANLFLNCTPTKSLEDITPFEALKGRKPSLHHLRIFGCIAYVKVPSQHLTKLDDRSIRMVYLGSKPGSKAYRLFDPIKNRICVSRDVKFKEDETWNWEEYTKDFDLDRTEWTNFIIGNNETPGTQHISNEGDDFENDVIHGNNDSDEEVPTTPNSQTSTHEFSPQQSAIHSSDSEDNTPSTTDSRIDHTPVRGYRTLNDIYDNTGELLLVEDEPRNYKEAAKDDKWIEAMKAEIDSINKNNTWRLTTLPQDHKAIGLKLVFKTKRDADGKILKHKARLVAK